MRKGNDEEEENFGMKRRDEEIKGEEEELWGKILVLSWREGRKGNSGEWGEGRGIIRVNFDQYDLGFIYVVIIFSLIIYWL